ncbi:MAG: hypothetical protein HOW97_32395, partial [Catenulispora sp.]|nr:hypothetical protein [Catenulispora sp.]
RGAAALGGRADREVGGGDGGLADTAILPPASTTPAAGGRKSAKGGSLPGSPRSDLLKELDDLGL